MSHIKKLFKKTKKKHIIITGIIIFLVLLVHHILGTILWIKIPLAMSFEGKENSYYLFISQKLEKLLVSPLDRVLSEINPLRYKSKINQFEITQFHATLSKDDIQSLNNTIELSQKEGYMARDINPRRSIEVEINGITYDAKIKFHGQAKITGKGKKNYTIKFKDTLYDNKKRLKFLGPNGTQGVNVFFGYEIANKLDLLKNDYELGVLNINGITQGVYLIEENFDKYLLEKNGVSDGIITKLHDEFNAYGEILHDSRYHNIKAGLEPSSDDIKINQYISKQYELFIEAIQSGDFQTIKPFIDIDYMARFEAGRIAIKDKHLIRGNNMKFFYRTSNGRFYPIFRVEGHINTYGAINGESLYRIGGSPEHISFHHYNTEGFQPSHLVNVLNTSTEFRKLKYEHLYDLLENGKLQESYQDLIKKYGKYIRQDITNREGAKHFKRLFKRGELFVGNNVRKLKAFYSFSRIYVNAEIQGDSIQLEVSPDSAAPVSLSEIKLIFTGTSENIDIPLSIKKENIYQKNKTYQIQTGTLDITDSFSGESRMLAMDDEQNFVSSSYFYTITLPEGLSKKLIGLELSAINELSKEEIPEDRVITNTSTQEQFYHIAQNISEFKKQNPQLNLFTVNKTVILNPGTYEINKTTIFPAGYNLIIKGGTTIMLAEGISFQSLSPIQIEGSKDTPVIITSTTEKPFGSFGYIGDGTQSCHISNLQINNGSEAMVNGVFMSATLSLHFTDLKMDNSIIADAKADDGLNIKHGDIYVSNSQFTNNYADQFDCDFCTGLLTGNTFQVVKKDLNGDGFDVSGSDIEVKNNKFEGFPDKGISVGENSRVTVENNTFQGNNIGIAIKDSSKVEIKNNTFTENNTDISMYQKKQIFNGGTLFGLQKDIEKLNITTDNLSTIEFISGSQDEYK